MMQIKEWILLEAAMMKTIYVLHSDPGAGKDKEQCLLDTFAGFRIIDIISLEVEASRRSW